MINHGKITRPQDILDKSIGEVIARTAALVPDKVAIRENNRICTYNELNARAEAFAAGLDSLGIRRGDRVAIVLPNSIEAITAYLGAAKLGVAILGINPLYREQEVRFMLEDSGAAAVITVNQSGDYNFIALLKDLQKDLSQLRHIIALERTEDSGAILFSDLIERHWGKKFSIPELNVREDLIMLLYTSGTTGVPKGAMITHYQAVRNASLGIDLLNVTADDVILAQLPWFHVFSFTVCINLPLITGATLAIQQPYNPVETLKAIEQNRVTIHNGTPTMFIMEMNHKDFNKFDLSSLRTGVAAGASFAPSLLTRINEEMGLNITSMFGMSELCGIATSCRLTDSKELRAETVGAPVPECKVKTCDSEGRELPVGEVGELWFWGWTVTKGYWNNEAETKKQITEDGWIKTGDMARILENGYVQIMGRKKELINRGGYKVYPNEIEEILIKHPMVAEVAAVGVPNQILGELICVCVIPKDKSTLPDIWNLREFCKGKIAEYKLPDELCIMEEFPRTVSGKFRKFGEQGIRDLALLDKSRQNYRSN